MNTNIIICALGVLLLAVAFLYFKTNKELMLQRQQINELGSKLLGLEKYIMEESSHTPLPMHHPHPPTIPKNNVNVNQPPQMNEPPQNQENSISKQYNSFINDSTISNDLKTQIMNITQSEDNDNDSENNELPEELQDNIEPEEQEELQDNIEPEEQEELQDNLEPEELQDNIEQEEPEELQDNIEQEELQDNIEQEELQDNIEQEELQDNQEDLNNYMNEHDNKQTIETETINELEFIQSLETIDNSNSEKKNINVNLDLETLSVKELQEIARNNKLKVKGRKNELIERINLNMAK